MMKESAKIAGENASEILICSDRVQAYKNELQHSMGTDFTIDVRFVDTSNLSEKVS